MVYASMDHSPTHNTIVQLSNDRFVLMDGHLDANSIIDLLQDAFDLSADCIATRHQIQQIEKVLPHYIWQHFNAPCENDICVAHIQLCDNLDEIVSEYNRIALLRGVPIEEAHPFSDTIRSIIEAVHLAGLM